MSFTDRFNQFYYSNSALIVTPNSGESDTNILPMGYQISVVNDAVNSILQFTICIRSELKLPIGTESTKQIQYPSHIGILKLS